MIKLYTKKSLVPSNLKVIDDVEKSLPVVNIAGTPFQRRVINEIEKGEYYDSSMFKDRFGGLLYYKNISTGSKALMLAESYGSNYCVDITEIGRNCYPLLLTLDNIYVLSDNMCLDIPYDDDCAITVDNVSFAHVYDYNGGCRHATL